MGYHTTVSRAAKALGVSVQAVYKRINRGTLDAVRVNNRWLVSDEALAEAVANPPSPGRPRKGSDYLLMNGPYPVMQFAYRPDSRSFAPLEVIDADRAPLGTVTRNGLGNASGLESWWGHRVIPESREGMDAKLAQLGLVSPDQIPFRNLGLSLTDQYWICPAGQPIDWHEVNYFENGFGDGAEQPWGAWLSQVGLDSPDNTSEGALPKRWVCEGTQRLLLKGCNPWTDQQPVNEVVATALHNRVLGEGEYVPYQMVEDEHGDVAACSCPCFVKSDEEYIPASRVLETQGRRTGESDYDALLRLTHNLGIPGSEIETCLSKMIVCDSIIANTDRHFRNFGFIRNIDTLQLRCAPLFDSGNSLWYDASEDAVARGDHGFVSRPFDPVPNRQLFYAGTFEWLDASALKGFAEQACEALAKSASAIPRLDFLREGIEARIAAVLSMRPPRQ